MHTPGRSASSPARPGLHCHGLIFPCLRGNPAEQQRKERIFQLPPQESAVFGVDARDVSQVVEPQKADRSCVVLGALARRRASWEPAPAHSHIGQCAGVRGLMLLVAPRPVPEASAVNVCTGRRLGIRTGRRRAARQPATSISVMHAPAPGRPASGSLAGTKAKHAPSPCAPPGIPCPIGPVHRSVLSSTLLPRRHLPVPVPRRAGPAWYRGSRCRPLPDRR